MGKSLGMNLFVLWHFGIGGIVTTKLQQKEVCDQERPQNDQKCSHDICFYINKMP